MDEKQSGDRFGLKAADLRSMESAFKSLPEIESVIIFGSRALGNFKNNSDIDLCLKGLAVDYAICVKLSSKLEELPMPYLFDIVNYNNLKNFELKSHIDRYGRLIFTSSE